MQIWTMMLKFTIESRIKQFTCIFVVSLVGHNFASGSIEYKNMKCKI